jgi:hypothetical protein
MDNRRVARELLKLADAIQGGTRVAANKVRKVKDGVYILELPEGYKFKLVKEYGGMFSMVSMDINEFVGHLDYDYDGHLKLNFPDPMDYEKEIVKMLRKITISGDSQLEDAVKEVDSIKSEKVGDKPFLRALTEIFTTTVRKTDIKWITYLPYKNKVIFQDIDQKLGHMYAPVSNREIESLLGNGLTRDDLIEYIIENGATKSKRMRRKKQNYSLYD